MLCFIWAHSNLFQENAKLYTVYLSNETKITLQQHTQFITKPYNKPQTSRLGIRRRTLNQLTLSPLE